MAVRVLPVCLVALLGLAASPVPRIQFTDTRLKNGLRLIVSEDHAAPMFSIVVNYNVGSRDERKGRTGFRAPLRAHDVQGFRERRSGRASVPHVHERREHERHDEQGSNDVLREPAGQPARSRAFLEADRMRSLAITKANLDNQRNAVQEERRLGVDNQPYGRTFEVLDELAYENFAYKHSVIGSMADLDAASVEDVTAFFKMYYAPNNAVIAIVGDVDTKTTLEKVRKYFGAIPSQPAPPAVDMTEPPADGGAPRRRSRIRSRGSRASTWPTRFRRALRPTTTR